jgi:HAD superfamily hydrolase (TIGR01509 family)
MVKAIIFDCFGVLTEDVWTAFCGRLDDRQAVQRAHELSHQRNKGFLSDEEFIEQVSEATGKSPTDIKATLYGGLTKNNALLDLIGHLHQTYRIGLLSNISSDWITQEFLTPKEQELFDTMVLSYEVGMTKPDPRIYLLTCERLRVAPKEALLIDDQPLYVEAARAEGLHGIVYEDMHSLKSQINELLATNY